MDELIHLVAQRAGISTAQGALAIDCLLEFLAARLPSPVVGRIREQMDLAEGRPRTGAEEVSR